MARRGIGLALLLAACAPKTGYVAPPPAEVEVARPVKKDVIDYAEFTGTTTGHKIVEIRSRVRGFVKEIKYHPGTHVKEGALLFQIDPTEYQAAVESAEADVNSAKADLESAVAAIRSAEARLELATTAVRKLEKAYASKAVSEIQVLEARAKRDVDDAGVKEAVARRDVAKARVAVAEAKLTQARLELGWTQVKAPMDGRAAMWRVEVGGLANGGMTLLTTMVNDDRVFAYVDIAETAVQEIRRQQLKQGHTGDVAVPVEAALIGDEGWPYKGVGDYAEPTVDQETGTLRVRAVFDNKEGAIVPGSFVRVRIPIAERKGALLVEERSIGNDQSGSFLLVVNTKDVVERRQVELGARHGHRLVALEGVREDDRIIVSGLQRARPGAKVVAKAAAE